jgi:hypothetical protein
MEITIQLPSHTIARTIPGSWNECTTEQAMTLLHLLQLDGPSLMAKRLSVLAYLLGLTDRERRAWELSVAAENGEGWELVFQGQLEALMEHTAWLLERLPGDGPDAPPTYQLSPTLTRCPFPQLVLDALPSFRAGQKELKAVLYAPADGLANITGEEMAYLFDQYERYTREPVPASADRLIAMLYRKGKTETEELLEENWHGDRRQPFNEHSLDARASLLGGQLDPMARNLLLFWFLSCRLAIIHSDTGRVVFGERQEGRSGADFGWWGTFRAITGDVLKVEELARRPYQDTLAELAYLEDERARMEMEREMARLTV